MLKIGIEIIYVNRLETVLKVRYELVVAPLMP